MARAVPRLPGTERAALVGDFRRPLRDDDVQLAAGDVLAIEVPQRALARSFGALKLERCFHFIFQNCKAPMMLVLICGIYVGQIRYMNIVNIDRSAPMLCNVHILGSLEGAAL